MKVYIKFDLAQEPCLFVTNNQNLSPINVILDIRAF